MSSITRNLMLGLVLVSGEAFAAEAFQAKVIADHTGTALASVSVRVRQQGVAEMIADLETGRDGVVRAELPAGEYRIEVEKASYSPAEFRVRVPAEALVVRMVRYGAIAGRVTTVDGRPLAGVAVFAMMQRGDGEFTLATPSVQARSEGNGEYRLFNLPPGKYAVGMTRASMRAGGVAAPVGAHLYPNNAQPQEFTISGGEEYAGVDFQIAQDKTYHVSGRISGADGMRASVALVSSDQPSLIVARADASAAGEFRIEGLAAGSYEVLASAPVRGYGSLDVLLGQEPLWGKTRVALGGIDADGVVVPLSKGKTARFVLRPGAGCPATAMVGVSLLDNWGAMVNRRMELGTAPMEVTDLAPGRYRVTLAGTKTECYVPAGMVVDLSEDVRGPIAVPFEPGGSIHGRVLTGAAKASEFVVALLPSDHPLDAALSLAHPEGGGEFQFEKLRPGRYWIGARRRSSEAGARWLPNLAQMVEIEVGPGGGTVVDPPVQDAGGPQ